MNKFHLISLWFFIFLVSCGSSDKKTQLEKLRKQYDQIGQEIKKLEAELGNVTKVDEKITQVTVLSLSKQTFDHFVEVQGKLDGEDNVGVSAQTVGIAKSVLVKEGDAVRKGQVLAQLDDQVMQKTLHEIEASYEFVKTLYEKQKTLWEQKIGSEVQYLSAKNNKESLENRIATLRDQIDMAKIKSPIDGTIEEVTLKVGQAASPGYNFFRVVNFSSAKVVADISENYTANIQKGDQVIIYFPDIQKEMKANVDFTSRYINPVNRTFAITIRFKPDGPNYRANMIANLRINDYHSEKTIVIPVNLIQTDQNGKFVFLSEEKDGKHYAKKCRIKEGKDYNGMIEILEGLKEKDNVISTGFQNLEEGQRINF